MLEQSVLKHFVDDFQPFNWSVVKKMQNNNNLWFVTEVPVLKLGSNRLAPGAVSNRNHYHDSWLNSSDCSLQESHKDTHWFWEQTSDWSGGVGSVLQGPETWFIPQWLGPEHWRLWTSNLTLLFLVYGTDLNPDLDLDSVWDWDWTPVLLWWLRVSVFSKWGCGPHPGDARAL